MAYYRTPEVAIEAGPDATMSYVWGDKSLAFYRCATCGCMTHWLGLDPATSQDRMGVNARIFAPQLIEGLRIRRFDGADTWKFLD
jgi:hypothetical protein